MYKYVKKLAATALPLCLAVLLSACGGAPTDEPSNNPSSVINKPQVSSAEASSAPSSATPSSASSSVATSTTSANASSIALSSTDSYTRVSRASSSAGNSSNGNSSSLPVTDTDSTPPTSTKLMLYQLAENSLRLKWDDATDNVGISRYEIERNGQLIAILQYPTNILSDHQLLAYTDYHYTITAFDAAGNKSEKSPVFTVRTLANANSSHSSSSKSSTSSTNSSSTSTYKTTTLRWSHPNKRESGQFLELDEIGGYEIRFKQPTHNSYTYILLSGNRTTIFSTDLIPTNSTVEIAVYDTNDLYSTFTPISAEPDQAQ